MQWNEPDLKLTKTARNVTKNALAASAVNDANDVIDYTLTIENSGNRAAENVVIWDRYPQRLGCPATVTATLGGVLTRTCEDGYVKVTIPAIAAKAGGVNGSVTLGYSMTLPADAAPAEQFTNTGYVTRFESTTNQPSASRFTYIPEGSPGPGTPNTEPIQGVANVVIAVSPATVVKTHTTAVTEAGNTAAQATIGERIDYTVQVTVPAETTVPQGAVLKDALPPGLVLDTAVTPAVSSTYADWSGIPVSGWTPAVSTTGSGTVTLTLPTALPNPSTSAQTFTMTYAAKVANTSAASAGGTLTNTATLDYTLVTGQAIHGEGQTSVAVVEPDIGLTMTSGATVVAGSTVAVDITVTNAAGQSVAHDTVVTIAIPTGLECPDTVPTLNGIAGSCSGGLLTWNLGDLAPGASHAATVQLKVPDPLVIGASYQIAGKAITTSMPGTVAGEREQGQTNPTRYAESLTRTPGTPQLDVTKSVDAALATIGQEVTYTIPAVVPAGAVIHDLTVFDELTSGLEVTGTPTGSCAPGGVTGSISVSADRRRVMWFLDEAAYRGDTSTPLICTLTIVATVTNSTAATHGATLTNRAYVAGSATDGYTGGNAPEMPADGGMAAAAAALGPNDSATVDLGIREPKLGLVKAHSDADGRLQAGETVNYTLTVTNTDTPAAATAYDVVVVDTLPTTLEPTVVAGQVAGTINGVAAQGAWDETPRTITWTIPSIASQGNAVIAYPLQGVTGIDYNQPIRNTATVTASSLSGAVAGERTSGAGVTNAARYTATDDVTLGPAM